MDLIKLEDKFAPSDIEWRIQSSGKTTRGYWGKILAYIDNRAIMERLDEVCGKANWRNMFSDMKGGVLCNLSINIPDQGWVTKSDGCDSSDIEPFKGALSGAMKRAAVHWGIGRYLYDLSVGFCDIIDEAEAKRRRNNGLFCGYNNSQDKKTKEWFSFYWVPQNMPDWSVPEEYRGKDHYSLDASLKQESTRQTAAKLPDAPPESEKKDVDKIALTAMQTMIKCDDPELLYNIMTRIRERNHEGSITDGKVKELEMFYNTKKEVLAGGK